MAYTEETPDGLVIYRASGLGACPAALYYDRQGLTQEPVPDFMQQKFDEGTAGEQPLLEALYQRSPRWRMLDKDEIIKQGFVLGEGKYVDQAQVWAMVGTSGKLWVRAHLDGIGELWAAGLGEEGRLSEKRVVEVKLFGQTYWDKYKREGVAGFPMYAVQLTVQMQGAGLPMLFVVGKKDDKGKLAIDEDGKPVIDIAEIDTPPVPWGQIMGKILGIEKRLETGSVPSCPKPLMYPCPFYTMHEEGEDSEQLPDGEVLLFDEMAEHYDRFKNLEAEYKERKQEVGRNIAEFLDSKGLGTPPAIDPAAVEGGKVEKVDNKIILGRSFEVTDTRYWRKGFVDEAKLKEAGINPDDYRQAGSETRYPRIKRRGGEDRSGN